jgi:transcriptional regulator GlxA family with amidase domain
MAQCVDRMAKHLSVLSYDPATMTRGPASQEPKLLRRLLRAKDRIDAASHEDWPVARLARVSDVSQAHFARSFKQAFGIPPHRYLLSRRIERAKALLRDTELPVTDVALMTGWGSLGSFGRIFRDITGESPGALRTREQAAPREPAPVPGCYLSAAHRPALDIAVLEKRRRDAADINGSEEKEIP